jgi:hypothetical protein
MISPAAQDGPEAVTAITGMKGSGLSHQAGNMFAQMRIAGHICIKAALA